MRRLIPKALDYLVIEDSNTRPLIARIHSETRKTVIHTIQVFRDGNVLCSCEDCKYRVHAQPIRDGSLCKHVTPWRSRLMKEASQRIQSTKRRVA